LHKAGLGFNNTIMDTPLATPLKQFTLRASLFFSLIFTFLAATGQEFITPFEAGVAASQEVYVVKENGERLEGKARVVMTSGRGIKYITLTLSNGEKARFNATELREIGFKNNNFTRVLSSLEQTESLKKIVKADWKQIHNQEYLVYSKVTLPSGKAAMMQLINPGFDSRVQVYYSLGSRKTSGIGIPVGGGAIAPTQLKLTGGLQRAYWVSKDNGEVFKLKRGNYNKKRFLRLFGDSPKMLEAFSRPYRFKDFDKHVFFYDQMGRN
jgi:hypothetical protein